MLHSATSGLPGIGGGFFGFSRKDKDAVLLVDMHDAEAGRLLERSLEAADRDVGARFDVLQQHLLVVHLVDVVAGEQHDELRRIALDDVDVLIDRVGRAEIPHGLGDALPRGQDVETLVASGRKKFQPRCKWRIRLCALYCVATAMRRMPELSALDKAKSMMRDLPPK